LNFGIKGQQACKKDVGEDDGEE